MRKISLWAAMLPLFLLLTALGGCGAEEKETVVIAMPRGEFIRNMETNYYKLWLEEETGLSITFLYTDENYTAEHLEKVFAAGDVAADAFFAFDTGGDYRAALARLQDYGEKGYILPLDDYLDGSTHLEEIFKRFDGYDLRAAMTAPDGKLYFMPGLDAARSKSVGQVLWINKGWLAQLGLPVPTTTEELQSVLAAFQMLDPNGNGLQDEIPLCGSMDAYGQQSYNALINAFVYNDPENSRLFIEDGAVQFAPMTDEWRSAMQYLNELYREGLLSPLQFELSGRSLTELASNPRDLLGAFSADHITDVLLQNTPEIMANFMHVTPLSGPEGAQYATAKSPMPQLAGVITANCENPEAVFRLFDLMLSEEAFLIGHFGEQGVDWDEAGATDMDFYSRKATVRVYNQLQNKMQNKHISELGPFFAYPDYADGVTFTGFESDQEYINARAHWAYLPHVPEERLGALLFTGQLPEEVQALRPALDAYTDECIRKFTTGELDPYDDAAWQRVMAQYEALGYTSLVAAAQAALAENEGGA